MTSETWIELDEERARLTREAMADVDAGRIVDHEVVLSWSMSLDTKSVQHLSTPFISPKKPL